MANIEEPEVHVYLKIFGILQFCLFSGFLKTAWGTQIEVIWMKKICMMISNKTKMWKSYGAHSIWL